MRKSNVSLRRQPSLLEEAKKVAADEGVALNQLINAAVAGKLPALPTESYFRERSARAGAAKAVAVLDRAGRGRPPESGGELLPATLSHEHFR